ncbi:hypothetical protein SAMN04488137_1614 [Fictibacillus solisalsi]|uniref:Uncharacterized protein n=1 Tax=Fictibacillus solisalsi TaxID=459525 RepID=A0A1G9VIF9_9BACL|nr:hypothetical protein [Fictibacillus solisalsi]SDM72088.1 hypothetical protein SAMN04488137_1614 [Fictibacillus solisalsi]
MGAKKGKSKNTIYKTYISWKIIPNGIIIIGGILVCIAWTGEKVSLECASLTGVFALLADYVSSWSESGEASQNFIKRHKKNKSLIREIKKRDPSYLNKMAQDRKIKIFNILATTFTLIFYMSVVVTILTFLMPSVYVYSKMKNSANLTMHSRPLH